MVVATSDILYRWIEKLNKKYGGTSKLHSVNHRARRQSLVDSSGLNIEYSLK